jgi:subtilisin family serine protease
MAVIGLVVFALFFSNKLGFFGRDRELLPASIGRILRASPNHILVKFKPGISADRRSRVMTKNNLKEKSEIKSIQVKLMTMPSGQDPQLFADKLSRNESDIIEFAEPDYIVEPSLLPNDPWFINWQKDKQQINSPAAWDITTGSASLVLAIVDTGVNCSHEDLTDQCVAGWNFYNNNLDTVDVHGHGTAVAGVASAMGNNGLGVAGNTWQSRIMPLRVSAPDGTATYSSIASAIAYAADHGAKVVNNSYQTGGSSTIRSAAGYLKNKGGLLVVSEGNYGSNTGYSNSPDMVSVSAVDASDVKYSWSSFGNDVDVAAPGCTGATTLGSGGYGSFCGTSNSAPEVSGVLMLIWSANPSLTPQQVQDILFRSSKDLGSVGWDQYYGWGRIDARAAMDLALQGIGSVISLTPTPSSTLPSGKVKNTPKPR